jgi:hypothetical protein
LLIPTASVFLNDMNHNSSIQAIRTAIETFQNVWVPANGGTETEFVTRTGKRLLYCYNSALARHAYLDLSSDIILTDDEACIALGLY